MAFDVHYVLAQPASTPSDEITQQLSQLRRLVQELPGVTVTDMVDFAGSLGEQSDELRRRMDVGCGRMIMFPAANNDAKIKRVGPFMTPGLIRPQMIAASRIIGFSAEVAPACEPAIFALGFVDPAELPQTDNSLNEFATMFGQNAAAGWWGSHLVRTESALDPEAGGLENFLCAHILSVLLVDRARSLGLVDGASDQGDYGTKRDISLVINRIQQHREIKAEVVDQMDQLLQSFASGLPEGSVERHGGPDMDGLDAPPERYAQLQAQERLLDIISLQEKTPWEQQS